ncbi:DNA repair protein [Psychrobacter sp. P11F6]|uniref:alpha-ketoglutarate-dependent dioxygenase AlkB family protein n=1 Tax=Psychrobacter sp. P11F6 TaxID=1699621 RepID=UPI0007128782|nr:alpha-ketoglutarate-dependent dioxygenase AlkB [Psychrobacter sp. P11F6]KRG33517.1 DNA repair protein [Psychrobacter sp. P11F6]
MTDLFAPTPTDNLLPYDGQVNDLGVVINDANALYNNLLTELPWQSDIVTLFGKTHVTTRQIVWMGDHDVSYYYSGQTRRAIPWTKQMLHVKRHIEQQLSSSGINVDFNSCLLNYYPSGEDGMGYHADDEKELGAQPIIASLSLGARRKFVFKHKTIRQKNKLVKVELYLESGQLIVMHGDTQDFWMHTITKTKTVTSGRISLTFRKVLPH